MKPFSPQSLFVVSLSSESSLELHSTPKKGNKFNFKENFQKQKEKQRTFCRYASTDETMRENKDW
jgi:hypothetical protein